MHDEDHYRVGIARFNERRFWDAHEAWEDAWKAETDPTGRLFYKGIIQTAAALVHWQRGNPRGLHLNWAKARPKLLEVGAVHLQLPIPPLIAYMDRFEAAEGVGMDPPTLLLRTED